MFHGSCYNISSSSSDVECASKCACVDNHCALCHWDNTHGVNIEINRSIVHAYIERYLVEDVYNMLSGKSNHHDEDDREWVVRVLRWTLAPICHVSAPELSFIANTDLQTLDIYKPRTTFNPKETMPCFRLHL